MFFNQPPKHPSRVLATRRHLSLTAAAVAVLLLVGGAPFVTQAQTPTPTTTAATTERRAVRLGAHDGYTRLVFEFPTLTPYAVSENAGEAAIVLIRCDTFMCCKVF